MENFDEYVKPEQVRLWLHMKYQISGLTSLDAFAKSIGFTRQYIHSVLTGKIKPSERLTKALGLKKFVLYQIEAPLKKKGKDAP